MTDSVRELLARLRSFLNERARDEDFGEELAAHLDLAIEDKIRRGMSAEEARRCALISVGGMDQARELHRENRGLPWLDSLLQDLRYGVRMLRRDAGQATFAILIVGLGIGASVAVFSIVQALVLRPLPFDDPGRLVWIANGESDNLSAQTVQVANLLELVDASQSFTGVAGFSPFYGAGDIRLTGAGEPERVTAVPVTRDFYQLLGVEPYLGRFFSEKESHWGAPKTVLLDYGFWQRRFGGDGSIVGSEIALDGDPVTVIGVLPRSFDFPSVFAPGTRTDLFSPFPLSPETNRQGNTLALIGRLAPGANLDAAQAESTLIASRIQRGTGPGGHWRNSFHPNLSMLREHVSGLFRPALLVLAGAVGFLMLLVCANLSNLLLARASVRQKEMAIRSALGAGRQRLIRQLLIESLMLSGCGAALGLVLAKGGTDLLARIERTSIPLLRQVHVDGAALGFALLVAVITGIVFGVAPALQASALAPHAALKESGRGSTGGAGQSWLRGSLVVSEIALACILLTGSGLLLRSLNHVLDVELGFETENVIAVRVDPGPAPGPSRPPAGYSTLAQKNAYFDEILRQVRPVPGVEAVGLTDALPLGDNFGWRTWDATVKGRVDDEEQRQYPLVRIVDDGYLAAMKIPVRAGRSFRPADNASSEPVVIVNEALASALWPGEDPLGRVLETGGTERRVVGVVGGVRYFALERDAGLEMYLPMRQIGDTASVDLVVRGSLPPESLAAGVREALKRADPNLPATEFRTMQQLVDHSVFPRRSIVYLLSGFAAFGVVLASLGIYGVISYSVSRRKQEIGIRMALGASATKLQTSILWQTARLAIAGLGIGLLGSWMAARALQGLLFEVTASDPATFLAVLLVLAGFAMLAGYLPARRASILNPLETLRCE